MENNKLLVNTDLPNHGIDSLLKDSSFSKDDLIHSFILQKSLDKVSLSNFSCELLSIRKDLDLIWWSQSPDFPFPDIVHDLQLISSRLSNLYSKLYEFQCR